MHEMTFDEELLSANLVDATNLEELFEREKIITNAKMIMLEQEPIKGTFDYLHLKAIHKFLFTDIYTWAGKDRYEAGIMAKFGKGKTLFTPYDKLPVVSSSLFYALQDEHFFTVQAPEVFAKSTASFLNGLNILHPFREGNGRVQRIFMQYLAENAGFELDFTAVTQKQMVIASVEGAKGNLQPMERLISESLGT